MNHLFVLLTIAVGVVCPRAAGAAPGDLLFKITAPEPQPGAGFGQVISAVDGDILIGEPTRRLDGATNALGRAYLFDGQTGKLKVTLDNPEPTRLDVFGESLSGGDGRIFIGTNGIEPRVYAFDAKSGQSLYTIRDPAPGGSHFGSSLAYGAGSLVASNPSFSVPFDTVGRAYLFDGATGTLQHVLANPEPKAGDLFGFGPSLAVFGNTVVVGALIDDLPDDNRPDGDNPGRVWAFDRLSGTTRFVLDNPNPDKLPPLFLSDSFGGNAAANDQIIAVGAQLDDTSGLENSGTVYVFDSKTGALRHTLFSPQPELRREFGRSVAMTPTGDVLVGTWNTSVNGIDAGRAYLFDGVTGSLLLDIASPEPSQSAAFGWSVAAMDNRVVVGDTIGRVYLFESIPEPSTLGLVGALTATVLATAGARSCAKRGSLLLSHDEAHGNI